MSDEHTGNEEETVHKVEEEHKTTETEVTKDGGDNADTETSDNDS
jgi:hypothetical protein